MRVSRAKLAQLSYENSGWELGPFVGYIQEWHLFLSDMSSIDHSNFGSSLGEARIAHLLSYFSINEEIHISGLAICIDTRFRWSIRFIQDPVSHILVLPEAVLWSECTSDMASVLCPSILLRSTYSPIIIKIVAFLPKSSWQHRAWVAINAAVFTPTPCRGFHSSLLTSCLPQYSGQTPLLARRMSSTAESEEIVAQKKALRKEVRAAIRELDLAAIEAQSGKVWKKVFDLPAYQSAKSIGLFLSMPNGEINTDEILKDAVAKGKDIYVPEVGKDFEKAEMELLKVILDKQAGSADEIFHKKWPRNKWKIPEPPADMPIVTAKPGDIDLLIVPGLGFDRSCSRIGQGKGYYDRFIDRMISNGNQMPLIAVGLTPQLVEKPIPVAEYDRKMDKVILPDETIFREG
eukprot:scaffold743_cov117-Cylindrotheca_fusiformis.AAC.9